MVRIRYSGVRVVPLSLYDGTYDQLKEGLSLEAGSDSEHQQRDIHPENELQPLLLPMPCKHFSPLILWERYFYMRSYNFLNTPEAGGNTSTSNISRLRCSST